MCYNFFNSQNRGLHRLFLQEKDRLHKKFSYLKSFVRNNDGNIDNISYRSSVQRHNGKNTYTFSFNGHDFLPNDSLYDVELKPSDYILDVKNNLLEPREKWFLYTCNTHIPDEVVGIVAVG